MSMAGGFASVCCSSAHSLWSDASPSRPREILATGTKRYSQFDEELIIRDFFQDRRGGFFVDVGAYRAAEGSTTHYLEEHLGWSGIAIDAQAGFADEWSRLRPGSKFFAYIVTDQHFERNGYRRIERYSQHDPANWYFTPRSASGAP